MYKRLTYLFAEETFEERCSRELRDVIWDCIDTNLDLYVKDCEIDYEENLYIPLLCELIAMEYLPRKWFMGEVVFTSQKLPKPIHKLTFEHNGQKYSIKDLIYTRLKEFNLKFEFYKVKQGFEKINIQKKRENKYFKLDATM